MKYVLLYEGGDVSKAPEFYAAHSERADKFHDEGTLVMLGPYSDPRQGALAIFTTRESAEEFAREDPFVLNGVVSGWEVREWNEALAT